jgi:hypothetical protein
MTPIEGMGQYLVELMFSIYKQIVIFVLREQVKMPISLSVRASDCVMCLAFVNNLGKSGYIYKKQNYAY